MRGPFVSFVCVTAILGAALSSCSAVPREEASDGGETTLGSNQSALNAPSSLAPPTVTLGFSPKQILSNVPGSTSTLTFAFTNANASGVSGVSFSDTLTNLAIAATGAAGGTCLRATANSFSAGDTSLVFSNIFLSASSSCTVTVVVAGSALSPATGWPTQSSGATSVQTTQGAPSNVDSLLVLGPATIQKAFAPRAAALGAPSTMSLTLSNPNSVPLTNVVFTDNFPPGMTTTNVAQSFVGPGRGTCTGITPASQAANQQITSISFNEATLAPFTSCTILVDVDAFPAGAYSNATTGAASDQTNAGPHSNAATLGVGQVGVGASFGPASIGVGETSTLALTLSNAVRVSVTNVKLSDTLPPGLLIARPATTDCLGTLTAVTGTTTLSLAGGGFSLSSTCVISVPVTASAAGTYSDTTSTVTYFAAGIPRTGPVSNTTSLRVVSKPTIALSFAPTTINAGDTGTLTYTLANPNGAESVSQCTFTDTLTGIYVTPPSALGGTCFDVSATPPLAANQTSLTMTVPHLYPGSCTVTIPITGPAAGKYTESTSGIHCFDTITAGSPSASTSITIVKFPDAGTIDAGTCGDGIVSTGSAEDCDDGAKNGTPGDCCSVTCHFLPASQVCRPATDTCDIAGMCTGSSSTCPLDVKKSDGSTCNDGNGCATNDMCLGGVCVGTWVICTASDECHGVGTCASASGTCSNPAKPEGTACSGGTCQSGVCAGIVTDAGAGDSGSATDAGSAADASGSDAGDSGDSVSDGGFPADASADGCDVDAAGVDSGSADAGHGSDDGGNTGTDGAPSDGESDASDRGRGPGTTSGCGCRAAGDRRVGLSPFELGAFALVVSSAWARRRRKKRFVRRSPARQHDRAGMFLKEFRIKSH